MICDKYGQPVAPLFPRLKEGILRDVFIQKAVVAWDSAPSNRIMVGDPMEMDQWLRDVRAKLRASHEIRCLLGFLQQGSGRCIRASFPLPCTTCRLDRAHGYL